MTGVVARALEDSPGSGMTTGVEGKQPWQQDNHGRIHYQGVGPGHWCWVTMKMSA
eukprot:CAMPEP_0196188368 /NCGR_PEP_ID=MMETSP0911-20130528/42146_1 /TAXON_ID=49265 /ORGANISM="Thalassiosira rotula, Strain GSO102" /LENGTH=54 /DNA_ID=CAMNT_0041459703 /DNA_START=122 /DNA_END=283 /DNA_ORIENTATION=+